VYNPNADKRTKKQREESTYVEISKIRDSNPAFQSPCKIRSKLKEKTDMDDFDKYIIQHIVHAYYLSEN
jgi:hypothetical protein